MDVSLREVRDDDLPAFFAHSNEAAAVFGPRDERDVTYWIGREFWGLGVATAALRELLDLVQERPLHARAAADNAGSIRVLEKCGFVRTGTDRGHANARGPVVDEVVLELSGHVEP